MTPVSRTRSIGTKITEEEFARFQKCADENHLSLSEWCREVLLNASIRSCPTDQAILAELIALRTIVANLIYAFTTGGKVTAEQMRAFVERADQTKLRRATELLAQIRLTGKPAGLTSAKGAERKT
jgi:hypothetical protein